MFYALKKVFILTNIKILKGTFKIKMINDKITKEKLEKYLSLSQKALKIIMKKIVKGKENEAKEIIEMASNYVMDAKHFESNGDYVLAYGALNYAHGWIDSGVRLGIFDVTDNKLFTIK